MLDKELAMKSSPQASFPTPKTPRNPADSLDKAKRMLNDTLENIAAMERDNIYDKEAADKQRAEAHARFEMARAAFAQSEAEPSKSAEKPTVGVSTPGEDDKHLQSKPIGKTRRVHRRMLSLTCSLAKQNFSPAAGPTTTPEAEKVVSLKADVITSAKKEDDVLSSLTGRSLVPMRISEIQTHYSGASAQKVVAKKSPGTLSSNESGELPLLWFALISLVEINDQRVDFLVETTSSAQPDNSSISRIENNIETDALSQTCANAKEDYRLANEPDVSANEPKRVASLPENPNIYHTQQELFRISSYEDETCDQVESLDITESSESEASF
eukprot:761243-Hanusia_phi.AAC.3